MRIIREDSLVRPVPWFFTSAVEHRLCCQSSRVRSVVSSASLVATETMLFHYLYRYSSFRALIPSSADPKTVHSSVLSHNLFATIIALKAFESITKPVLGITVAAKQIIPFSRFMASIRTITTMHSYCRSLSLIAGIQLFYVHSINTFLHRICRSMRF